MKPKVSVIIPTYNRQGTILRAVQSVLGQSFEDWELIIIDDGSTDDTEASLKPVLENPKVSIYKTENRGVSAARNFGIHQAQADWMAFLDSDDEWLTGKLEAQWELLQKSKGLLWVHGEEVWIRNGVRVNPMKKHKKSGGSVFENSLKLCCVSPSTVLIHKTLFERLGLFKEDFPVCEDYDLWLRFSSQHFIGFVETPTIRKYGGHDDQLSRKYFAMDYWRVKSMFSLLDSEILSEAQSLMVREEILKKGKVLLRGYRKHQNMVNFDEVFQLYSQTQSR